MQKGVTVNKAWNNNNYIINIPSTWPPELPLATEDVAELQLGTVGDNVPGELLKGRWLIIAPGYTIGYWRPGIVG